MISDVKYLVGDEKISSEVIEPFSEEVCKFLSLFAKDLNEYKDIIGCPAMFTSMHDKN